MSKSKSRARLFVEVIGLAASLLGIITFLTGIENIGKFFQPAATFSETEGSVPVLSTEPLNPSATPAHTSVPSMTLTDSIMPTSISLPAEIADDFGVEMVLVPAGKFTMGGDAGDALAECQKYRSDCDPDWFQGEEPPHQVYLDAFYMDKYEVTNVHYKACVDAGTCDPPQKYDSYTHSRYYGNSEFDNYPVINIDWNMASTYCQWRDARLPTEAEWEKAARGTNGRTYPWGEEIGCNNANYSVGAELCIGDTAVVGSYQSGKSMYSVYDMAGNVWEWVNSLYRPYPYNDSDGREALNTGGQRVIRGGGFTNDENALRAAFRNPKDPTFIAYLLGFRCAR